MGVVWSGLEFRVGRRDKGIAYAEVLAAAGVPVEQLEARGHFHSSSTMVDVIASAASGRERMAQALRRFAGLEEPGVLPKAAE
jgi:acetyl esterase/lipase